MIGMTGMEDGATVARIDGATMTATWTAVAGIDWPTPAAAGQCVIGPALDGTDWNYYIELWHFVLLG
jgi:hypothetical protein